MNFLAHILLIYVLISNSLTEAGPEPETSGITRTSSGRKTNPKRSTGYVNFKLPPALQIGGPSACENINVNPEAAQKKCKDQCLDIALAIRGIHEEYKHHKGVDLVTALGRTVNLDCLDFVDGYCKKKLKKVRCHCVKEEGNVLLASWCKIAVPVSKFEINKWVFLKNAYRTARDEYKRHRSDRDGAKGSLKSSNSFQRTGGS